MTRPGRRLIFNPPDGTEIREELKPRGEIVGRHMGQKWIVRS
jgi:hypothetical protein